MPGVLVTSKFVYKTRNFIFYILQGFGTFGILTRSEIDDILVDTLIFVEFISIFQKDRAYQGTRTAPRWFC